jgi:hypothetical protein
MTPSEARPNYRRLNWTPAFAGVRWPYSGATTAAGASFFVPGPSMMRIDNSVHREQHELADIGFARQEHHHPIDARSRATMRWGAAFERVDHAGEIGIDLFLRIARDLERLVHDLGLVVPDRARRQLHTVADDVVLIGEDVERVFAFQRVHLALRHREGVV